MLIGVVVALAPVLLESEREATVELVFFDGEESLDWRWNEAARALFGSKRYVRRDAGLEHDPETWEPAFGKDHAARRE